MIATLKKSKLHSIIISFAYNRLASFNFPG